MLTALGASICYGLSFIFAREIVEHFLHNRLQKLRDSLRNNSEQDLFVVLLGMRLFPLTPNWFINMAAPHADVPLSLFMASVFFGLLPYNFVGFHSLREHVLTLILTILDHNWNRGFAE